MLATVESLALNTSPAITLGYVMQVIISLLIVLGFIYLAAKYLLPKMPTGRGGKLIQIIDRVGLEPQVTSYVLKIGKISWLIVVSSKNVVKIDRLSESELA